VKILRLVEAVEEDALDGPQQVGGRDDHAGRGDQCEHRRGLERTEQHEELPDESVRAGHADGAERDEREQRREHRNDSGDAAIALDEPRVPPLVDHADEEEERARGQTVIDHHHQRALHALHGEREDAEHHEAQMAHRAVGDELLEVGLHERDERAVHDADDRQHQYHRSHRRVHGRRREERYGEPEEAEGAELQHDGGKHDRTGGRRLDVRIGQPGVQREHRHLHREGEEEGAEEPERAALRELRGVERGLVREVRHRRHEALHRDRRLMRAEVHDADQHEQRSDHRVDEELEARVDAPFAPPDPDDEVHRDEHGFPHHVEQEEIERHEDAEHSRREQ
jgi:hypothetical protein